VFKKELESSEMRRSCTNIRSIDQSSGMPWKYVLCELHINAGHK